MAPSFRPREESLCHNRGLVAVATTTNHHRPILFVARQEHGDSLSVPTNVLWLVEATLITSSSSLSPFFSNLYRATRSNFSFRFLPLLFSRRKIFREKWKIDYPLLDFCLPIRTNGKKKRRAACLSRRNIRCARIEGILLKAVKHGWRSGATTRVAPWLSYDLISPRGQSVIKISANQPTRIPISLHGEGGE